MKFLCSPKFFPVVMITLNAGASIRYFAAGDWRHGFYWLCAAGLNLAITI
jgi:hypothetical protein